MPTIDAASGNVLAIIDGTVGGASIPTAGDVANSDVDNGNPVKIGGYAASASGPALVSVGDRVNAWFGLNGAHSIAGIAVFATDARTNVIEISGVGGGSGVLEVVQYLFNGASLDRQRTPSVFKSFSALAIANETTVWTPPAGKKFRLMGFVITQTIATGDIVVRDNTAGTTILTIPATPVGQPLSFSMGNGILSAAANNVLTFDGGVGEIVSGFVYGTEE